MRKLFLTLSLMLAVGSTYAVPAKQAKKVLTLADGTQVAATLKGDEFLNWWEADNGMKYVAAEDGTFELANFEVMKANAELRRAPIAAERAQRMAKVANAAPVKRAAGPARVDIGEDHIKYTGKKKGIIILYQFSNTKFADGHDNAYYKMVANERDLQHADGYIGSVSDWFLAQSNGTFELDFDVYGPYTSKHTASYYGNNDSATGRTDAKVGYMIRDACDAAVAEGVNFDDYDWDGDGYADQVFVLYAGLGEASGGTAETVWPHEYQVRYTCVGKPLSYQGQGKVDTYACANELELVINPNTGTFTNQKKLAGIGTICHEFSHCLGFPDMYDTANNGGTGNYGMGYFDVMCSGSYNGDGFIPCNYTAYERIYAGWTEPIVLDDPATIKNMKSSNDYGRPFIMYNDRNNDEFYTIENRQPVGWDAAIYGASGLMITHVDYDKSVWGTNSVNSSSSDHQRCTIFHADNSAKITYEEIQGDLYPYVNSRTGEVLNDELSDDSSPAATLYNKNADGSKYMGKPITAIEKNTDGTINFLVLGGSDDNVLDNTTVSGISGVKSDAKPADGRVYSIDGRYLGNDINRLGRGIYIVDGKKEVKL